MKKYKTEEERQEAVRGQKKAEHQRNKERYKEYNAEYRKRHLKEEKKNWKLWYTEHREERRKYNKEYWQKVRLDPTKKQTLQKYETDRKTNFPGKIAAVQAVNRAIKNGVLKRQPCAVCGILPTQGHHKDYRRKLDVVWLCLPHHREIHEKT